MPAPSIDSDRRRAEDHADRRATADLKARPIDEAALAERLLDLMEKRNGTTRQSASREETPGEP